MYRTSGNSHTRPRNQTSRDDADIRARGLRQQSKGRLKPAPTYGESRQMYQRGGGVIRSRSKRRPGSSASGVFIGSESSIAEGFRPVARTARGLTTMPTLFSSTP